MNQILLYSSQIIDYKISEKIKNHFFLTRGGIYSPRSKSLGFPPCDPWVTLSDCWSSIGDLWSSVGDLWVSSIGTFSSTESGEGESILYTFYYFNFKHIFQALLINNIIKEHIRAYTVHKRFYMEIQNGIKPQNIFFYNSSITMLGSNLRGIPILDARYNLHKK